MGLITKTYIEINQHLKILFEIFSELIERFYTKYFHVKYNYKS